MNGTVRNAPPADISPQTMPMQNIQAVSQPTRGSVRAACGLELRSNWAAPAIAITP
jgi:hypothetical protein